MAAATTPPPDILDLRHFSAGQIRPLLREQAKRWQARLLWDYTPAVDVLLDYIGGRSLPGFVAVAPGRTRRPLGFAFCVYEASKAVIGDVYAFDETGSLHNPVCETLLTHLIEMLQATPGVDRIESQLLMFPAGAFAGLFERTGFRTVPRLFMTAALATPTTAPVPLPPHYALDPWQPSFEPVAAALIHRAYLGHMDAQLNDQYQTLAGAGRFLHNILRFPGCGVFDTANSLLVRDTRTGAPAALLLCSLVEHRTAHITQLCVDPALRNLGLGGAVLHAACRRLARSGVRTVSLAATEANAPALTLYARHGFTPRHRFEATVWQPPR